jgi:hypothetical protein
LIIRITDVETSEIRFLTEAFRKAGIIYPVFDDLIS